jgi:hypothetical protein
MMSGIPPSLLPAHWTAIAERQRDVRANELLQWHELPDAQLSLVEAPALAAKGVILMANRHFPDRVELVVRPVASMEPAESSSKKGRDRQRKTRQSTAAPDPAA